MLVLTRKLGQTLQIGSEVKIVLLEVQGDSARVGIEAPRRLQVLPGERTAGGVGEVDEDDRGDEAEWLEQMRRAATC